MLNLLIKSTCMPTLFGVFFVQVYFKHHKTIIATKKKPHHKHQSTTERFTQQQEQNLFFKLLLDYVEILEKHSKALIAQLTELTVKTLDKSMTNYTINLLFAPCIRFV